MTSTSLQSLAFPVLVADIGGTNARFAIIDHPGAAMRHFDTVETKAYANVDDAVAAVILPQLDRPPLTLVFDVAGPIGEERTPLTNCHWVMIPKDLIRRFALDAVILFNDFEALALALPDLGPGDLQTIGDASPPASGSKLVIGPGTGLGAAGLLSAAGRWLPVPGEGGHIDLAPITARDLEIWPHIERPGERVSGETLVCGSGLLRLYQAIARADGKVIDLTEPSEVTAEASTGNATAREAVELFSIYLGRIAGNLALTFLAKGGVYIGGGVSRHIKDTLKNGGFRAAFEDKYPHEALLASMATVIIVNERPALEGLASFARTPSRFIINLDGRLWRA